MNKMMLVAAACAMVVAPSMILGDDVTSVNTVGYYSVTIPAGGLALITPVLEGMDGGTLEDLIGDQMQPGNAAIYFWDRIEKGYKIANYDSFGQWSSAATNVVMRGDGVWLQNDHSESVTLTFMGEVPGEYNDADVTTVDNLSGLDAVGYAYPVDVEWLETELASALPSDSAIYYWNVAEQSYSSGLKDQFGEWSSAVQDLVIKAGSAFWIETPEPVDPWVESVPYDL